MSGVGWRMPDYDSTGKIAKYYSSGWDFSQLPPMQGDIVSDTAAAIRRGINVINDHTRFTNSYQNTIFGYAAEDGTGYGWSQDMLNKALASIAIDPANPMKYMQMGQAYISPMESRPWVFDSLAAAKFGLPWCCPSYDYDVFADSLHYLSTLAYLNRHVTFSPLDTLSEDSLFDSYWYFRPPTAAELSARAWLGVLAGMKGWTVSNAFDDGLQQIGFLADIQGKQDVKSSERSQLYNYAYRDDVDGFSFLEPWMRDSTLKIHSYMANDGSGIQSFFYRCQDTMARTGDQRTPWTEIAFNDSAAYNAKISYINARRTDTSLLPRDYVKARFAQGGELGSGSTGLITKLSMPPAFGGLFYAVKNVIYNDLGPIGAELSKLQFRGMLSWHKRNHSPLTLARLPIDIIQTSQLNISPFGGSVDLDSATYIDVSYFVDPTDSLALYVTPLNRRLWMDTTTSSALGKIDYRVLTFTVRDSAFNPFYIGWPTWDVKNIATGWDTIVGLDSLLSITLKPGEGALLRIAPSQSMTLSKLSTNVWNNARHMAYNETIFDTLHRYWMVYERKGNIYANAPLETPSETQLRRKPDSTNPEVLIEPCQKSHNPAIAINPDVNWYGVVYSIDHAGTTGDSTFIIIQYATAAAERIYMEKDTLEAFPVSDPYYVASPAISPTYWNTPSAAFWVGWRNPTKGGAICLAGPSHYRSNIRCFSGGDPSNTKFVSLASRVIYGEPPSWPGYTRCYIAFQETYPAKPMVADYGNIFYLEAWRDTLNANQIDTGRLTEISAGSGTCINRLPCITIDGAGQVTVTWELQFQKGGIQVYGTSQYAGMRKKDNLFPPNWTDFTLFKVKNVNIAMGKPVPLDSVLVPQDASTYGVWVVPWPTPWRDFTRIAWSDDSTGHVSIAHFGFTSSSWPVKWYRHHLVEPSLEPSLSVWEQNQIDIPEAVAFRNNNLNTDTTYNAQITRYDFPLTPVDADSLLMQSITASNKFDCIDITIRAGGKMPISAQSPTGGIPSFAIWQPLDSNPFDTATPRPTISWVNPRVRTSVFSGNAGDSLSYTRFFAVGNSTAGDTAAVQGGLDTTSGDYFRASINLRRAADSSIVLALDTALLTRSNFVSSTIISDSGFGHAVIPITDSFFLTMDVARGHSNDNLTLAHIESYNDSMQDDLPAPPSSGGPAPKAAPGNHFSLGTSSDALEVTVHPNPVRGTVKICVADLPQGIPAMVDVVNQMGAQVAKLYDATPDAELGLCLTLDCSNLPSGIYYADLQTEGTHNAVRFSVEH